MDKNYQELLKKTDTKLEEISTNCPKEVIKYFLQIKKIKNEFDLRKEEINLISLMYTDNPCDALRMHNVYLEKFM